MVRSTAALAALLVAFTTAAAGAESISRQQLLARLAASIATFQADFSLVIGTEASTQVLRAGTDRSSTRTRTLVSEVFFLGADEQGRAMTVRNVQRADGQAVPGNAQQIREALALPPQRRLEQLKALADASARYNLGVLTRNFNDPTLALLFASKAFQPRFRFELHEPEELDGRTLHRLAFTERSRPTVIRDGRTGRDIAASGNLWVDDAGVVWRSEVRLEKGDTFARLQTVYDRDAKLGIMVPRRMNEDYRYRDGAKQQMVFVSSEETYSDYRRFETSARIVTP
jgi:hypothetical protein